MSNKDKSCRDCKHFWRDEGEWVCLRDGEYDARPIEPEREAGWIVARLYGLCGREGRYWSEQ